MSCGWPSSVTAKSCAVNPSTTLPSLSLTVTVWTMRRVVVRKTGCCVCGACCCAAVVDPLITTHRGTEVPRTNKNFLNVSVPRCVVIGDRISKPHSQACLYPPHLAGRARQTELWAAHERVDAGVGHVVQDVGGVDAEVHVEPAAPREGARDARVETELHWSHPGVAPGVSPFPSAGRRVSGRIEIVSGVR